MLTELNHGLLRSAFTGQGNAVRLSRGLQVLANWVLTLNSRRFRDTNARELGLDAVGRLAWGKERRVVQAIRARAADGRSYLVANMHCTSSPDERLPDAELLRAAWFATSHARPEDVVILAGDFNVRPERSRHSPRSPDRNGASRRRDPGSTTCSCAARSRRRSGAGTTRGAPAVTCCSQITRPSSLTPEDRARRRSAGGRQPRSRCARRAPARGAERPRRRRPARPQLRTTAA